MKNWKLKPHVSEEFCKQFPEFSTLGAQLLYNRGLTEKDQVAEFIEPRYEDLHDPFLFQDMQKAVDRIWQAIENNEGICIYGDYDADAVTANAVLQQAFRYLGVKASSYIPDRFTEGYGVNIDALKKIVGDGCKVIITVDCGTNSTDAAEFCKQNNIDFIITDHHEIIGPVPDSYALINPKNPNDNYPYHDITGVGVAFKLACGILSEHEKVTHVLPSRNFLRPGSSSVAENIRDPETSLNLDPGSRMHSAGVDAKRASYAGGWEKWLLDLVAIGTVADCHSLMGENRILVKYGLKVLQKTKWVGLRALMEAAGLDFAQRPADTYTLGFVVAPRLNAAGRLEHANVALHLLMEEDGVSAQQRSMELEEINRRRQDLTERVMSEAREQALRYSDRKVLVLLGEDWPKGVVGLVAGRIADEFHKPTIVMDKEAAGSTGSARTVGEFNVVEALKHSSEHLVRFGGHQQAAGLTLKTEEYENFYQKILEYAETNLSDADLERQLTLDAELNHDELNLDTVKLLEAFEPFGVGNPKPKFLINNVKLTSMRLVGNLQKHMQMALAISPMPSRNFSADENQKPEKYPGSRNGDNIVSQVSGPRVGARGDTGEKRAIPAIMFNANDFAKSLKVGDTVDVACELMKDGWNGREQVKLRVIDIRRN